MAVGIENLEMYQYLGVFAFIPNLFIDELNCFITDDILLIN